jgi:hypothetical protein
MGSPSFPDQMGQNGREPQPPPHTQSEQQMPAFNHEADVLDQLEQDFTPSVTTSAEPVSHSQSAPSVHRNLVPLGSQELEEEEPPVASGDSHQLTPEQQEDMRRGKHSELIEGENEGEEGVPMEEQRLEEKEIKTEGVSSLESGGGSRGGAMEVIIEE